MVKKSLSNVRASVMAQLLNWQTDLKYTHLKLVVSFLFCFLLFGMKAHAHLASIELSGGKNFELQYSKKFYKDYELSLRFQKLEKKFKGRAGTKVCLVFCFTLPVEEKNLKIESYSLFAKNDFSDVFDKYDIGTLAAGVGISYENIEAQNAGLPSATTGVNTNFFKLLLNAEHKYPIKSLGEKVYLESLLEYGFFNQGGADITEWTSKTQLLYDIKENITFSVGYKLRGIEINYDKDNEIIDLNGTDSSIFVGVKSIW